MAADLSHRLGWLKESELLRIRALIEHARLPVQAPPTLSAARLRELMSVDKKVQAGKLRLVLLKKLGDATIIGDVPEPMLDATLAAARAAA